MSFRHIRIPTPVIHYAKDSKLYAVREVMKDVKVWLAPFPCKRSKIGTTTIVKGRLLETIREEMTSAGVHDIPTRPYVMTNIKESSY